MKGGNSRLCGRYLAGPSKWYEKQSAPEGKRDFETLRSEEKGEKTIACLKGGSRTQETKGGENYLPGIRNYVKGAGEIAWFPSLSAGEGHCARERKNLYLSVCGKEEKRRAGVDEKSLLFPSGQRGDKA